MYSSAGSALLFTSLSQVPSRDFFAPMTCRTQAGLKRIVSGRKLVVEFQKNQI